MSEQWRCGDCGTEYPKSVDHCTRYFDDYLSLRGGSIESAINRAVASAIEPFVLRAEARLNPRRWVWLPPRPTTPIVATEFAIAV